MDKVFVKIEDIAEALDMCTEGWSQFLNTETGKIEMLPDFDNSYVDMEDEYEKLRDEIDETDKYEKLPDQFEIHEYAIMKDFAYTMKSEQIQNRLLNALNHRKSYRNFKDAINQMHIADQYYAYRKLAFCDLACRWCLEHDVPFYTKIKPLEGMVKGYTKDDED